MRILDARVTRESQSPANTAQFMAIVGKQKVALLSNQGCAEQFLQNDCHGTKTKVQFSGNNARSQYDKSLTLCCLNVDFLEVKRFF
jgi:hypothetical protein